MSPEESCLVNFSVPNTNSSNATPCCMSDDQANKRNLSGPDEGKDQRIVSCQLESAPSMFETRFTTNEITNEQTDDHTHELHPADSQ